MWTLVGLSSLEPRDDDDEKGEGEEGKELALADNKQRIEEIKVPYCIR